MNKSLIIAGVLIVALGITGFVVYTTVRQSFSSSSSDSDQSASPTDEDIPQNTSVSVTVASSKNKDHTVVIGIDMLEGKYVSIGYEVTYETQGTFQGVNSGSKPIDVTGKDSFSRDVYLGTCSKNVCKPHTGVTQVTVSLEFIDKEGNKSQFSKDFPL